MTNKDRDEYRRMLEAKKRELAGGLGKRDQIAIERAADEVDDMLLAEERDFAIHQLEREAALLRQVGEALDRLAAGTYGICLRCDEEINARRLSAVPWAAYCRECQEVIDASGESFLAEPQEQARPASIVSALSRRRLSDAA